MISNGMKVLLAPVLAVLTLSQASAATPPAGPGQDFLSADIESSVKPGVDFFQYANGAWFQSHPIPPTETSYGIGTLVRDELFVTLRELNEGAATASAKGSAAEDERKIGDYWRAAMDTEGAGRLGARPLESQLAQIGAVKTRPQALDAAFDLMGMGVESFFQLYIAQDEKESGVYSIHVFQGGLGLPDRDFYVNADPSIASIRKAYVVHIARMLQLLGQEERSAASAAKAVFEFETTLAKASRKLEDTRDPEKNYTRISPKDLQRKRTPSIDWPVRLAQWKLAPAFVVAGQPEYLDKMDRALRNASVATLQNYLRYRLVTTYGEYLGGIFDDEDFDFYHRTLNGQKEPLPQWKRVLGGESAGNGNSAPNPIGMLVGRKYVEARFPEATKQRYVRLVHAIQDAYEERISHLDWMSDATRAKALEKLHAITLKVGYPDTWPDTSTLQIGAKSYCENMMQIQRWQFQHMLAYFGKPVDRTEWFMTPQTYNAYYNPTNNEIVVPASNFVIPGVEDAQIDDAVAYGYVGASTIGHEITHGFDDEGRKFDAQGNLVDWWTKQDAVGFDKRASVIVKQFDSYEALPGFHINGKASLGENLADFGGVELGLDAFRKTEQFRKGESIAGLTPLQRYFLGYALSWMVEIREEQLRKGLLSDVHAPARWRVIGPLSNVPEFYEAFGVTQGQPMWRAPADRAHVW